MTMLRNTDAETNWGAIPATICALDGNGNLQPLPANQDLTLLPSATRAATTNTANQTNLTGCGVVLFLNVTAASGTGGLQVALLHVDPASGVAKTAFLATAITTTGMFTYVIYPGATTGGTQTPNSTLTATWKVQVVHGDGTNYTYSLGASVIF